MERPASPPPEVTGARPFPTIIGARAWTSLRKQVWVAAIVVLAVVQILPLIQLDYGRSGDGYGNLHDVREMLVHGLRGGLPTMHRWPPGFPIYWAVLAMIVPWGNHVATNAVALLFFVMSAMVLAAIVRDNPHRKILIALFVLAPVNLKNATVTQDFHVGVFFGLLMFWALERRTSWLAGLFFGLAIAARITAGAFGLSVFVFFLTRERNLRSAVSHAAVVGTIGLATATLCYAPFIWASGLGLAFFRPAPGVYGAFDLARNVAVGGYNLVYIFGPVALAGLLGVLLLERKRVLAALPHFTRPRLAFALMTIAVFSLHCIYTTMKGEYFLPAVPFVVLVMGELFSRRALTVLLLLVASYSVVNVDLKGGVSGHRSLAFRPAPGLILADYEARVETQRLRNGIAALSSLKRAVVLTGMGGELSIDNDLLVPTTANHLSPRLSQDVGKSAYRGFHTIFQLRGTDVFLAAMLPKTALELLRAEGYRILMFSENAPSMQVGYDPYTVGAEILPIFSHDAFYKRVGGGT